MENLVTVSAELRVRMFFSDRCQNVCSAREQKKIHNFFFSYICLVFRWSITVINGNWVTLWRRNFFLFRHDRNFFSSSLLRSLNGKTISNATIWKKDSQSFIKFSHWRLIIDVFIFFLFSSFFCCCNIFFEKKKCSLPFWCELFENKIPLCVLYVYECRGTNFAHLLRLHDCIEYVWKAKHTQMGATESEHDFNFVYMLTFFFLYCVCMCVYVCAKSWTIMFCTDIDIVFFSSVSTGSRREYVHS